MLRRGEEKYNVREQKMVIVSIAAHKKQLLTWHQHLIISSSVIGSEVSGITVTRWASSKITSFGDLVSSRLSSSLFLGGESSITALLLNEFRRDVLQLPFTRARRLLLLLLLLLAGLGFTKSTIVFLIYLVTSSMESCCCCCCCASIIVRIGSLLNLWESWAVGGPRLSLSAPSPHPASVSTIFFLEHDVMFFVSTVKCPVHDVRDGSVESAKFHFSG